MKTGKHTVTALTREESKVAPAEGAKVVKVNYDDEGSLVEALKGQQFLIITLSVHAPKDLHGRITAAAGKAGVPYIMPNCYGYPVDFEKIQPGDRYLDDKAAQFKATNNGVSSAVILSCGFWYEWSLALGNQWFGFDIKDRKVTFFDDGKRIITVSTWDQCGNAIAALLDLPESGSSPSVSGFKGGHVSVYSFRVSQRDMLDSLHRVLGTTDAEWEISYEASAQRIKDGAEELQKGVPTGFAKILYGKVFLPSNETSDFAGNGEAVNDTLGLPKESLDEATKRAVTMAESGWAPFS